MKKTSLIATYELTFHDLKDDLGIHAKKIIDVKVLRADGEFDDPVIQITVEEIVDE
jgi:hypothetical protein